MTSDLKRLRNIGISAHIDSGKTTLSERILFYSGRIHRMQEVHAGGGATMDHMELEQERGITITSAATSVNWKDGTINLIDTPGHVDFTVEVERSLRVLDGAVLVLCSVGGVQAQSITIDRQMNRYHVPRLALINKMDRTGADPARVVAQLKEKLDCEALLMQLPIGTEADFEGVVDLVTMEAIYFEGTQGEKVERRSIPESMAQETQQAHHDLLEALSMYSDELMEMLLAEEEVPVDLVHQVVRSAVWSRQFTPVFLASAYRNKGVQPLMDAILHYLPSPLDCEHTALKQEDPVETIKLLPEPEKPTVAMAFKIIEDPYGTLTFMRIYQGTVEKGGSYFNQRTGKKERISRLQKIHAASREEIEVARAGDIVAAIGIDSASGDTFCSEKDYCTLESMFVPEPVIQVAVMPQSSKDSDRLSKALARFRKEDPTLSISVDHESGETLMAGMGELHLDVYIERIRREYQVEVEVSPPKVNYREAPTRPIEFDIKHKKQTGGSGQYAHIVGQFEVLPDDEPETFQFEENIVGGRIPQQFIPAVEKGFRQSLEKGPIAGFPIVHLKAVVNDGSYHEVDSSDMAFRTVAQTTIREFFPKMKPALLEPVMKIEIEAPSEFQGNVVGDFTSRRGIITVTETLGPATRIQGEIPLAETFGYSTNLRSLTQGQGTFSMEFSRYKRLPSSLQEEVVKERKELLAK